VIANIQKNKVWGVFCMKWNKSFLKRGFIIFLLMMLVVGCSQGSSGSTDNSTDDSTDDSGGESVKLTMQAWGNPAEIKVYQRAVDAFMEENPNIDVNLIPVPGDQYEQKLLTQFQGGEAPDVFYSYENTMAKLIEAEQVQPLSEFLKSSESYVSADDFPEGLWGPARKDGEIYGVTPDSNPMVIYYNKKLFEEVGIKTPQEYYDEGKWNWETFKEITGKLRDADKYGFVVENWWGPFYSWVWSNGGRIFDEDGNFVLEENEKAKETIEYLYNLVKDGNGVYAGSLPKGQGSDAMFMSNQVGMVSAGRWYEPMFNEAEGLDYDYIYWPSTTGKNEPVGVPVAYLAVNKSSKHLEEAMKFITYYVSKVGQEVRLADGGNAIPSIVEADEAIKTNATIEHTDYLFEARNLGYAFGAPMTYEARVPGLPSEFTDIYDVMYLQEATPEETIEKIIEKGNEILAEE
jgi:multiple sugar transport system substrate-binding protein